MIYKREKNKIEIKGSPKDVKWPMWFDIISNGIFWLLFVIILLFIIPKASVIPYLWKWIRYHLLAMIPFVVLVALHLEHQL